MIRDFAPVELRPYLGWLELDSAAARWFDGAVPWSVRKSSECPASKPWAVVKDADSSVVACHDSKESAEAHVRALYVNVKERKRMAESDRCQDDRCGHARGDHSMGPGRSRECLVEGCPCEEYKPPVGKVRANAKERKRMAESKSKKLGAEERRAALERDVAKMAKVPASVARRVVARCASELLEAPSSEEEE